MKKPSQSCGPVFIRDFLDLLEKSDEPGSAYEAEWSGDWRVVSLADDRHLVLRGWEEPGRNQPTGIFRERSVGLLCAAALPLEARPSLFVIRPVASKDGWSILVRDTYTPDADADSVPVGEVREVSDRQILALHLAGCLARSPHALALLLEAAGPTAIRRVSEILYRRLGGSA